MATKTAHIGLVKPDGADYVNRAQLNQNFDTIDREIAARSRVVNLLDNSDFRNPVNQRGATSYSAEGYTIDRWRLNSTLPMSLNSGYITFANDSTGTLYLEQRIPLDRLTAGQAYTVAVKTSDGAIACGSCVLSATLTPAVSTTSYYVQINIGTDCGRLQLRIRGGFTVSVVWVALYEGAYTTETLPSYQPKGYAAELAECHRYYQTVYRIYGESVGSVMREAVRLCPPMRIAPTVSTIREWAGNDAAGYTINASNRAYLDVQYTGYGNVTMALSADL